MKIEEKFRELKEKAEGAYMPHIYYGDPSPEFSRKEIKILAENGADLIEFGIPFSDPTADGPVFQEACERALENGTTPESCLKGIEKLREDGLDVPIILTTYYNILHTYGPENFLERLSEVGVQGIIVPNLPLEEAGPLIELAGKLGINVILQVTPNTSENRLKKIANSSSGFLYVVNVEGVTGTRELVQKSTVELMKSVRENAEIPLMGGFGISKKKHAFNIIKAGADGVITGSALGKIYTKNLNNPEKKLDEIKTFAKQIKNACNKAYRQKQKRDNLS